MEANLDLVKLDYLEMVGKYEATLSVIKLKFVASLKFVDWNLKKRMFTL